MAEQQQLAVIPQRQGILAKFGERYDLEPQKVMNIVAQTVFKGSDKEPPLGPEEVAAALIVCNAYNLNPFTKEIYAFRSKGKLLIVVGVDGWSAIVNRQEQLNGIEFEEHFDEKGYIKAVTCKIHRKDCALPVVVTEYTHECRRDSTPWQTMPIRMTRNRAFVQCARIAFSVSGIIDNDEAQTIEGSPEFVSSQTKQIIDQSATRTDAVKAAVHARATKATKAQPQTVEAQVETQAMPREDAEPAKEADTTVSSTTTTAGPTGMNEAETKPAQTTQPAASAELW